MSIALDTLTPNARIQNIKVVPKIPRIERNHYSDLYNGHDYYGIGSSSNKGSSGKRSIALTALTLLAFMFFLNILQNCLQDQMALGQSPQVMVLSSRLKQPKEADKRKDEQPESSPETDSLDDMEEEDDKKYMKIAKQLLQTHRKDVKGVGS